MFEDIKKVVKEKFKAAFDFRILGKDALEALAFVIIHQLKMIAKATNTDIDDDLVRKLELWADSINPARVRAEKIEEPEAEEAPVEEVD